jgi:hypothetical protein
MNLVLMEPDMAFQNDRSYWEFRAYEINGDFGYDYRTELARRIDRNKEEIKFRELFNTLPLRGLGE